jgi:outer membrane murein-binding lipoprotein Lpp
LKGIRSFAICAVAFLVLAPLAGLSTARADDADLAQVLKTLKTLESRVATLESEKQQYRREADSARAETQALKQKLGRQPNPNLPVQLPPSGSYAMVTKAPLVAAVPTWGGFYAGASFGLTSQHANQDGVAPGTIKSTYVAPGFGSTTSSSDTLMSSLGGRGLGAMANLYLGYNYMLPSNFLVGAQIEGGISNTRTTLTGPYSDRRSLSEPTPISPASSPQQTLPAQALETRPVIWTIAGRCPRWCGAALWSIRRI